eukprot:NODE_1309_length_460_cov_147.966967_g1299_i0.p2 GENE.NODE_1309_length_460_cov_147.966967_g1299_i0~~NODE_1309_length_460_cov_147.966967_g1299_i0.p2  ORF type:complete len:82 (+),score=16.28 NODE_1309_length_460_cov_147.966967_g1299_i0:72-317(+)
MVFFLCSKQLFFVYFNKKNVQLETRDKVVRGHPAGCCAVTVEQSSLSAHIALERLPWRERPPLKLSHIAPQQSPIENVQRC